jgi:hypothetical protein
MVIQVKRKREKVAFRKSANKLRGGAHCFQSVKYLVYDRLLVAAPPISKGFCFRKNAFTLPPLISHTRHPPAGFTYAPRPPAGLTCAPRRHTQIGLRPLPPGPQIAVGIRDWGVEMRLPFTSYFLLSVAAERLSWFCLYSYNLCRHLWRNSCNLRLIFSF